MKDAPRLKAGDRVRVVLEGNVARLPMHLDAEFHLVHMGEVPLYVNGRSDLVASIERLPTPVVAGAKYTKAEFARTDYEAGTIVYDEVEKSTWVFIERAGELLWTPVDSGLSKGEYDTYFTHELMVRYTDDNAVLRVLYTP